MKNNSSLLVSFFLRAGLAVVFLYAAFSSLLNPSSWVGFFPSWLRSLIPDTILLFGFSSYEILLSLWLFSSWRSFYAAVLAAVTILGIISANFGALDIIFRDVAIFFMAVSLALLHWEKRT